MAAASGRHADAADEVITAAGGRRDGAVVGFMLAASSRRGGAAAACFAGITWGSCSRRADVAAASAAADAGVLLVHPCRPNPLTTDAATLNHFTGICA